MNLTTLFRRMALGLVLSAVPMLGSCGDNTLTWTEEVKLLDGRVITVTQKRRYDEDKMPREAWLTFRLPEFGNQEIVWHENLEVRVLNVYQGKLYVVGGFGGVREFRQYGRPVPAYVGFRYDAEQWVRIPFSEIPVAIYSTNMYPGHMLLEKRKHVSVTDKIEMFKDDRWVPSQRGLDSGYKISDWEKLPTGDK